MTNLIHIFIMNLKSYYIEYYITTRLIILDEAFGRIAERREGAIINIYRSDIVLPVSSTLKSQIFLQDAFNNINF